MSNNGTEMSEDVELMPDEEGMAPDLQGKIKKMNEDLARCDAERREYLDGWQRAKADLINYKKDEGKRTEDVLQYASVKFLEDILPVLDSFDLALGHGVAPETEKGIVLIRSQLADVLKRRGVEEITVNAGDAFDPAEHESIGEAESDAPAGTIAEISQKGYALAGRIIRPARVKLSKGRGV